jgi:hypothetical protein
MECLLCTYEYTVGMSLLRGCSIEPRRRLPIDCGVAAAAASASFREMNKLIACMHSASAWKDYMYCIRTCASKFRPGIKDPDLQCSHLAPPNPRPLIAARFSDRLRKNEPKDLPFAASIETSDVQDLHPSQD